MLRAKFICSRNKLNSKTAATCVCRCVRVCVCVCVCVSLKLATRDLWHRYLCDKYFTFQKILSKIFVRIFFFNYRYKILENILESEIGTLL